MKKLQTLLVAVAFGFLAASLPACDAGTDTGTDAGSQTPADGGNNNPADGGNNNPTDGGTPDAGEPDCFMNPTTHYEIINACTDAVKVDKTPTLPGLIDGGLPPLP